MKNKIISVLLVLLSAQTSFSKTTIEIDDISQAEEIGNMAFAAWSAITDVRLSGSPAGFCLNVGRTDPAIVNLVAALDDLKDSESGRTLYKKIIEWTPDVESRLFAQRDAMVDGCESDSLLTRESLLKRNAQEMQDLLHRLKAAVR